MTGGLAQNGGSHPPAAACAEPWAKRVLAGMAEGRYSPGDVSLNTSPDPLTTERSLPDDCTIQDALATVLPRHVRRASHGRVRVEYELLIERRQGCCR
jgi:hypothetical protein